MTAEQQTGTPIKGETPAEKRAALMESGKTYRESQVHQSAAQTWAIVQQAEAQEAANEIARQHVAETRIANLIAFYSTPHQMFPAGVREQIATALGITSKDPESQAPGAPVRHLRPAEPVDDFT